MHTTYMYSTQGHTTHIDTQTTHTTYTPPTQTHRHILAHTTHTNTPHTFTECPWGDDSARKRGETQRRLWEGGKYGNYIICMKEKTHRKGTVCRRATQGIRLVKGTEVPVGGSGWYQSAQPPPPAAALPEGLGAFPGRSGKSLHSRFRQACNSSLSISFSNVHIWAPLPKRRAFAKDNLQL